MGYNCAEVSETYAWLLFYGIQKGIIYMSQKKVLEYKEEKKNRKETLKKKKIQALVGKIIGIVVVVALVAVIGFVVINNASSKGDGTDENNVNVKSVNDYVGTLNMNEAMSVFDDEDEDKASDEKDDKKDDKKDSEQDNEEEND